MKKVIIITIIVIAAAASAYAVWTLLRQEPSAKKEIETSTPTPIESKITLAEDKAIENVLRKRIQNANSFVISPNKNRAIVSAGTNLQPLFIIFDKEKGSLGTLPAGTVSADWHPTNDSKIVYLRDRGSLSDINILNIDNKRSVTVATLAQKDLVLEWPSPNNLYIKTRPSKKIRGSVWKFNITNKTISTIIDKEFNLSVKWLSPNLGLKLSSKNEFSTPVLSFIDGEGKTLANLDFITLPSKCVLGENAIYCAVPSNKNLKNYPEDYMKRAKYYPDNIYRIPLINGSPEANLTTSIFNAILGINYDMTQLRISDGYLYFIDRYDNKVYKMRL